MTNVMQLLQTDTTKRQAAQRLDMTDLYPRSITFTKNINVNCATCNGICSVVYLPNMKNRVLLSDHYTWALIINNTV